jgi:outer membrane protein assembly factor BamB
MTQGQIGRRGFGLAVVILAVTLLAGCDWSMLGCDAGHTHLGFDTGISATNVVTLHKMWASSPFGNGYDSSPVVANGKLLVSSDDGLLRVFDAIGNGCFAGSAAGTECWHAANGNAPGHSAPASTPLVYGMFDSRVGHNISYVVVGGLDGNVRAYDEADGRLVWIFNTGAPVVSSATLANVPIDGGRQGAMVFVESGNALYGLDPQSGQPLGDTAHPNPYRAGTAMDGSPTVVNGIAYVNADESDGTKSLYAFSVFDFGFQVAFHPVSLGLQYPWIYPVVSGGVVYDAGPSGSLIAINATSGVVEWQRALRGGSTASVAVANGRIYAPDTSGFREYDPSGNFLGQKNLGLQTYTAPAVDNGLLYVSNDNTLWIFNAATLVKANSVTTESNYQEPAVADKAVFISTGAGVEVFVP